MYLCSHSIEEIKQDALRELIEEIDQDFSNQPFDSKWINKDNTEYFCDVSYAYSWWKNYREQLKNKYFKEK